PPRRRGEGAPAGARGAQGVARRDRGEADEGAREADRDAREAEREQDPALDVERFVLFLGLAAPARLALREVRVERVAIVGRGPRDRGDPALRCADELDERAALGALELALDRLERLGQRAALAIEDLVGALDLEPHVATDPGAAEPDDVHALR